MCCCGKRGDLLLLMVKRSVEILVSVDYPCELEISPQCGSTPELTEDAHPLQPLIRTQPLLIRGGLMTNGRGHPVADVMLGAALGAAAVSVMRPRPRRPPSGVVIVHQGVPPPPPPVYYGSHPPPPHTCPGSVAYSHPHPPSTSVLYTHQAPPPGSVLVMGQGTVVVQRAPVWQLGDRCYTCRQGFTLFDRRHHCRQCGRSVCGRHSSHALPLPHFGMLDMERVCDPCYTQLMEFYRTQGRPTQQPPQSWAPPYASPPIALALPEGTAYSLAPSPSLPPAQLASSPALPGAFSLVSHPAYPPPSSQPGMYTLASAPSQQPQAAQSGQQQATPPGQVSQSQLSSMYALPPTAPQGHAPPPYSTA